MTNVAAHDEAGGRGSHGSLTVPTALRLAWATYVTFLILPFLLFLCAVWVLMIHESAGLHTAKPAWFLASSAYLLVVVPASFFLRGRLFKEYWTGHPIQPAKYLFGMTAIWSALEFGGIISLLGCFVDQALLPNLLPALVAFMFFVTLWPSGRAMVRSVGNEADASIYEQPR